MDNYIRQKGKIKHFRKIYIPLLEKRIEKAEEEIDKCLIKNDYKTAQNIFDEINTYFKTLTNDMKRNIYPTHLENKISELEYLIKTSEEESNKVLLENPL